MFNVMRETMALEIYHHIKNEFLKIGLKVMVIEQVEGTNDLIVAEKTQ